MCYNIPMPGWLRLVSAVILWSFNETAFAQRQITIATGVPNVTIDSIMLGIINVLLALSGLVATALFLLGALYMVGSAGSEQLSSAGKRIMKASLIGLAIILASWLILSTMVYLIAG